MVLCDSRGRGVVTAARRTNSVPAGLSADGSIVPCGSMMPFPIPPFDMICTGCTEYIPGGARATELEEDSVERREAQQKANRRVGGRARGSQTRLCGRGGLLKLSVDMRLPGAPRSRTSVRAAAADAGAQCLVQRGQAEVARSTMFEND